MYRPCAMGVGASSFFRRQLCTMLAWPSRLAGTDDQRPLRVGGASTTPPRCPGHCGTAAHRPPPRTGRRSPAGSPPAPAGPAPPAPQPRSGASTPGRRGPSPLPVALQSIPARRRCPLGARSAPRMPTRPFQQEPSIRTSVKVCLTRRAGRRPLSGSVGRRQTGWHKATGAARIGAACATYWTDCGVSLPCPTRSDALPRACAGRHVPDGPQPNPDPTRASHGPVESRRQQPQATTPRGSRASPPVLSCHQRYGTRASSDYRRWQRGRVDAGRGVTDCSEHARDDQVLAHEPDAASDGNHMCASMRASSRCPVDGQ